MTVDELAHLLAEAYSTWEAQREAGRAALKKGNLEWSERMDVYAALEAADVALLSACAEVFPVMDTKIGFQFSSSSGEPMLFLDDLIQALFALERT